MRLADLQRAFVQGGRDCWLKMRRLGVEQTTTVEMMAIRQTAYFWPPGFSFGSWPNGRRG
jgi:hypothetical protein